MKKTTESESFQSAVAKRESLRTEIRQLTQKANAARERLKSAENANKFAEERVATMKWRHHNPHGPEYSEAVNTVELKTAEADAIAAEIDKLEGTIGGIEAQIKATKAGADMVKAGLAAVEGIASDISSLENRLQTQSGRLAALETTADLDSETEVAEIVRLQAITAMLPRRVTARQESLARAESGLVDTACHFVGSELSPKLRDLRQLAEAKVRQVLGAHYSGRDLDDAIERSNQVQEVAAIQSGVSIESHPLHGPVDYAQRLLLAWDQAGKIEAKPS